MATLSIEKKYSITLDSGREFILDAGGSVSNVGEVAQREFKVPTGSEVEVLTIGATVGAGQLTDLKFMVLVNQDDTNTCRIRLKDTGGDTADFNLQPGQAFDVYNTDLNVSESAAAFASFSTIDTISAQFDTADGILGVYAGEAC